MPTMYPSMVDHKSGNVLATWHLFSKSEKKNMMIYIGGIMVYKFGVEVFIGSFICLATNRYDYAARLGGYAPLTFGRIGLMQGLNQACQCFGAILVAPLVKRWETRIVLSVAILVFAVFTTVILIADAATGGTFKPPGASLDDFTYYGKFNTDGMIPVYCVTGFVYGMVELTRRVIVRDIVHSDVQKLRRLDATIHISYEVTGTAGAFVSALVLIPSFGNNMAIIVSPFCFAAAAVIWSFVSTAEHPTTQPKPRTTLSPSYLTLLSQSSCLFFVSIYTGGRILFTSRKFIWLLPSYSLALYAHRYLENNIAPIIAQRYMGNSAWAQVMVGGSNFGELMGALFVFLFTNLVNTPIPWLRFNGCGLLIIWYLAFWHPSVNNIKQAFVVAATMMPMSLGWAAGDVSLSAYIQAVLHRQEHERKDVSALVAVIAFLYSTYIITYSIASPVLGSYVDRVSAANHGDVHCAVFHVGGGAVHGYRILKGEDLEAYRVRDMEERPPQKTEGRSGMDSMEGLRVGDYDWFSDL
ncbi:hypothetical protein VE00_10080 [Pseudogymnoascus sp. WSF 3629]|nr:hypothetical protein VE00_10080 [Pseudogymnoascus sp. WSF 3629]